MKSYGQRCLAIGMGFALLASVVLPTLASAHGKHPGRAARVKQCRRLHRTVQSVAGHTTNHAIERFRLKGLVSQADIDRAQREMARFLKWKLMGAPAVCGTYVGHGYGHFERAYGDEAAALMLGVISFHRVKPEIVVPDWLVKFIKKQVQTQTAQAITAFLSSELGFPPAVASFIGSRVAAELAKKIPKKVTAFLPKKYDVDNRLVMKAIEAKRQARTVQRRPRPLPRKTSGNVFRPMRIR